jgi:iron complex outermembrane receptor protein
VVITPQPLGSALDELAARLHIELSYTPEMVKGLTTPGIEGDFTPREALQALLAGTGLEPQAAGDGFVLRAVGSRERDVVREEITVTAPPAATVEATRVPIPVLLTPQSIEVVPEAVIRDQKALTLTEAVRNVSGVATDFGFNGGTQPLLILRGFQMTSMSAQGSMSGSSGYYVDGTRVQGVPVNMANVQSVEVVKGPATVLFGRAEPGGLVNVVSREAQATPAFGFEQTAGSFGTSRSLLEATGALNSCQTLLGRAAVSYLDEGSNRDYVVDRLAAFDGNLVWLPREGTRLAFTVDRSDQKYRNDYGIPALGDRPADLPASRQFNDSPELSRIQSDSLRLDLEQRLAAGWSVKARALSLSSDTREVDVTPYRLDLTTGSDCLATNNELCRYYFYARPDGRYRLWQFNADLLGDVRTGALRHQVLVGVDRYSTRKEGTTYLQQLPSVDIDHPDLGHTPALDPASSLSLDVLDRNSWTSFYVQDQVTLGAVHVVGALRHDRTSAIFAPPGTPPNRQSFTTPRLGVVWEMAESQALYAQYQDSVAANNGRDLVTLKELAAERANQVEVGYKLARADGRASTTVAVYQLTKRNRADYSLYPIIQTVGEARSRGLEWDVAGQVTPRLAFLGSYSYTDAVVTRDPQFEGTRLANVPRNSGSFWGRYQLGEVWAVGGGGFFQGQRQGDQANSFQLPGYVRFDAMVSRDFRAAGLRGVVQLNVENLFDRRYYTGSHQFVQDWIQLGSPRTALLTLRLDR